MLIVGLDLETTGLEPGEHKIIEVYAGVWNSDTRERHGHHFLARINPKRSIQPAAQAVHGISLADLEKEPLWIDVAGHLRRFLDCADLFVAHNGVSFDIPFLNHEFEQVKLPPLTKPCFDTMLEARWATPTGAVPNLGALCWACEVAYDPALAHAADYDVEKMMACFFRGIDFGFFNKPFLDLDRSAA